jgi:hypothetical protein
LRDAFGRDQAEIAHLKAIGLGDLAFSVANLVSSQSQPELSLPSGGLVADAEVIVNARVAADPMMLEDSVRRVLTQVCRDCGCQAKFHTMQSFRPGRPQPTHRYALAKA